MRIFGAGLRCQVRNLLCGLFEGGAYLAMCVCAAVLRCHTRNLLLCGLFGGADLAMRIFGAGLMFKDSHV